MRCASARAFAVLGALTSGACLPSTRPPDLSMTGQTRCSVVPSQARPLIVEWPAADRSGLEALASQGIVAVRYTGCEMEVLSRCSATGSYRYLPTTRQHDRLAIRTADELYAKLPLGAVSLEGKLASAGELNVSMTVVGNHVATRAEVDAEELKGDCARATHLVVRMSVGAFEFFAGSEGEVAGGVAVGGGAGVRRASAKETLNQAGHQVACEQATRGDERAPEGCAALLRLEVAPIRGLPALAAARPVEPTEGALVSPRSLRVGGLSAGGAGLVAITAGIVYGVRAHQLSNEVSALKTGAWQPELDAKVNQGSGYERNMYILLGIGTAFAGAGGVLYYLGLTREGQGPSVSAVPLPGGGGMAVRGTF